MHSVTELPLHGGHAPKWLFKRMVKLSRAIGMVIIDEYGADELLRRLSDSNWFQALACTIGYDWHSSGTTTVTVGALKEALNDSGEIFFAGGKGKAGLNTPNDIVEGTEILGITNEENSFKEWSRLSAKIDATLVYDKIGIYQHAFIFTKSRKWAVVQQAMRTNSNMAIRFQWLSDAVNKQDVADEPHVGIDSELRLNSLDLTASSNSWAREGSAEAIEEYAKMFAGSSQASAYPARHHIIPQIDLSRRGMQAIIKANEADPQDYKELLLVKGVGRSTLRSLALVSSLIYDKELAYRDPVAYAYTVGGKDGIPFPVNKATYDSVVDSMEWLIDRAHMEKEEKYGALKRLDKTLASSST